MFFQVQQIGRFRAAPAVDALVVVAHHAEVAVAGGELMDQLELRGVGVLVFVHHDIAVAGAAGGQDVGMLGKKLEREQNQVVEIHRVAGAQGALVPPADMLGQGGGVGIARRPAARSPPFLKRLSRRRTSAGSALAALSEMWLRIFLTAPS